MAGAVPTIRSGSAWTADGIARYLREAEIPVRLACIGADGAPLLCSLWYLFDDGAIWCATRQDARLVDWLRRDRRCAFEVSGEQAPYRGVRGQGQALLCPAEGPAVLSRLIDRYLKTRDSGFARWLLSRQAEEVAIRIQPDWVTSWDFAQRMSR